MFRIVTKIWQNEIKMKAEITAKMQSQYNEKIQANKWANTLEEGNEKRNFRIKWIIEDRRWKISKRNDGERTTDWCTKYNDWYIAIDRVYI